MLKQARSRFNMIRRMLSAHPSDVLSPKEQINLGQYGKINKVCHECVCQLGQQRFHGTTAHTRGCPIILQVQTGLRELRRLSVNTASDIMTKLQRIDTRTTRDREEGAPEPPPYDERPPSRPRGLLRSIDPH